MNLSHLTPFVLVGVAGLCSPALATNFPEAEPNDNKAQAQQVTLAPGDSISGSTTGTSTTTPGDASADTFRIRTAAAPAGLYRYTLSLTSPTNTFTSTIRGRNQSTTGVIDTASDATAQTGFLNGTLRDVVWYDNGQQGEIYYRVTGAAGTTSPYSALLSREAAPIVDLSPTDIGAAGQYTIRMTAAGATTDPELWILDGTTFAPIPDFNNDDTTGAGLASTIDRTFAAGSYILAITDYNSQTNLPSPADEAGRGEVVVDFPNVLVSSDREAGTINFAIEIHQGPIGGPIIASATATNTASFQYSFIRFTVGGGGTTCPADTDDGSRTGTPDGAVTIDDLIYFLVAFEDGSLDADLDADGVNPPNPDGAVTIDDLVFFLLRFEAGC